MHPISKSGYGACDGIGQIREWIWAAAIGDSGSLGTTWVSANH